MITKKGKICAFTLVELLVVITIISILLMIAYPNFRAAQDRAKESSVKSNMYKVYQCAEMYSIDWGGIYPLNAQMLKDEAMLNKYWKPFKNPFTNKIDIVTTQFNSISSNGLIDPIDFPAGSIGYKIMDNTSNIFAVLIGNNGNNGNNSNNGNNGNNSNNGNNGNNSNNGNNGNNSNNGNNGNNNSGLDNDSGIIDDGTVVDDSGSSTTDIIPVGTSNIYGIYAAGKEDGKAILDKGRIFYLSNQ